MKSLTESILSTSGVGIDASIKKWLEENKVIHDNKYTIKNHIVYPNDGDKVLLFKDFNELPDYIQFADGKYTLILDSGEDLDEIKSFRGLPKCVSALTIKFAEKTLIPELNIKTSEVGIYYDGIFDKRNKLNITYDKKCSPVEKRYSNPGNVHFDYCCGADLIDLQNCKFNGFDSIEFGLYAEDPDIPQRSTTKLFNDIFDYRVDKELTRQQKLKLEKLLKSLGFDSVTSVVTPTWKLFNVRGTWHVINFYTII